MEATETLPEVRVAPPVQVVPVRDRRLLRKFIDLPYQLYRDNPYWVPPLRRDVAQILSPRKSPFFEHGQIQPFLALDASGRVVGRIAAIVNGMHLKKYNDGVGFFGFFECVPDFAVAEALFNAAADCCAVRACNTCAARPTPRSTTWPACWSTVSTGPPPS